MNHPIFEKIEKAKQPEFGDILSKSFELYKKTFSKGISHALIMLLVAIPFICIIYIPLIPMYIDMIANAGDPNYRPDFFKDFSPLLMVGWVILVFVLSFIMQVINISIYGHFLKMLKNEDLNTSNDIGGYFTIAKNHTGKILLLSLASMGIAIIAALLCYLPIFYVLVPLNLMLCIFIFNQDLSVGDIIKAGFKLGNKHWLLFFGLILLGSILSALGIILCYIGIIATMFFSYIVMYYIYKDTIGFEDEIAKIEEL